MATHESFLSPNVNDIVSVYAIKFSDRTDLMEGALVREPTRKGNFFSMHINLDDYVQFLRNAVVSNKTMFMVSTDPRDHPSHRLVGVKAALPELIKDYEVNAKRLSVERQLPEEYIDYAALGYFSESEGHGHSHSHDGHSHSQDEHPHSQDGHLYSHGGHSHDHEIYNDRSMHVDSHEQIRIMKHTHQAVVLPSETAIPPIPVMTVATSGPQMTSTVVSVHEQEMLLKDSKLPEITVQHESTISDLPVPANIGSIPKVVPDVAESVVAHGFPSSTEEISSFMPEHLPPPGVVDINFAEKGNKLPHVEISRENISPNLAHVETSRENIPPSAKSPTSQSLASMQQANIKLLHSDLLTTATPSSFLHLSSSTPPDTISQINLSVSSVNNIPSHTDPSVLIDEAVLLVDTITDNTRILSEHNDVSSVSPSYTESTVITMVVQQFDSLPSSIELNSKPEGIETTTTIISHVINTSPLPSTTTSHTGVISTEDSKQKMDTKQGNVDGSVQTENEVKAEDALGYCVKNECDKVYNSIPTGDEKSATSYLLLLGRWLSKLIGIARYMLPSVMSDIDDAGVVVTFFLPICLLIHLLRIVFYDASNNDDTFDRRMLHNALTTIREREVQIKLMHAEMEKGKNAWNIDMDEKLKDLQTEMNHLKARYRILKEENDELKVEKEKSSQITERERLQCRDLIEENRNLAEKNELLMKDSSEIYGKMEMLREENERLVNEVAKKSAQLMRLESEANSYTLKIKNLKDQLKTSVSECKMLRQRVEELQNEIVQLSEIINEIRNSNDIVLHDWSSGGTEAKNSSGQKLQENTNDENGWSDFDEFGTDNNVTTVPERRHITATRLPSAEIMEVAKLRVQLKTIETDLDQAKLTVQKQLNERDHLMRKVELAESEAAKRLKEVETKEAERIEAQNQFKRILGMVEEREAKLRNAEELAEKLRSEVVKSQEEVRRLEGQKKDVEFKLLEADQELKRLKAEYTKLETRNFHEIRQCKQAIAVLQQQTLEQVHVQSKPSNMFDNGNALNISASSSSDRDCGPSLTNGLIAPPPPLLSHVRPLWDDDPSEVLSSRVEPSIVKKLDPVLSNVKAGNGNINYNRGSKQRRREREHSIVQNMDSMQSRHKKEGRRMRSRSHGRHPVHTDYFQALGISGPCAENFYSTGTVLNKQNSKSGVLYYSSGGSNDDGRSPPPEMALLSGIPPPGPMIKKPTPRPKSSTEPLERR